MAKKKIFIDGREGTTGLKIFERLGNRTDIEILSIDEEKRKDSAERKRLINESDYTFLCRKTQIISFCFFQIGCYIISNLRFGYYIVPL